MFVDSYLCSNSERIYLGMVNFKFIILFIFKDDVSEFGELVEVEDIYIFYV